MPKHRGNGFLCGVLNSLTLPILSQYLGTIIQTDEQVAIKKMRAGLIDKDGFKSFSNEVIMLSEVNHKNIVRLVGFCLSPSLLIVMQFVDGGSLENFIKKTATSEPPSKLQLLQILVGIARAIEHLHAHCTRSDDGSVAVSSPIIHRDIKSDNVLLTSDLQSKLADLGEARCEFG